MCCLGWAACARAGLQAALAPLALAAEPTFPFSPVDAYNKNITLKSGRCSALHGPFAAAGAVWQV